MVLKWQYNGASFFFIRFVNLETKGNKIFFFAKNKNAFALLLLCLSFWYNYFQQQQQNIHVYIFSGRAEDVILSRSKFVRSFEFDTHFCKNHKRWTHSLVQKEVLKHTAGGNVIVYLFQQEVRLPVNSKKGAGSNPLCGSSWQSTDFRNI